MFGRNKKFTRKRNEISLDEIFLDSKNIPGFKTETLEGKLEKPISRFSFAFIGAAFFLVAALLLVRIADLQIVQGGSFELKSESNRFRLNFISSERGVIYDRNKEKLAWNVPAFRIVLDRDDLKVLTYKEINFLNDYSDEGVAMNEDLSAYLDLAKSRKTDLIVAVAYSWESAEHFRKKYYDIPLRVDAFTLRKYSDFSGVSHVVGYLGYGLSLEEEGASDLEKLMGKDGVEKSYDAFLGGRDGVKLMEIDSKNQIVSESVQKNPGPGKNIIITIDGRLSAALYDIIGNIVEEREFVGASAVVVDIPTSEVLSLVNYPEYNSSDLTAGTASAAKIASLINNPGKPFFNRAVKGLYPSGSAIKPLVAIAALNENVIDPEREILSTGSISIPNPYDPDKKSVFYDWKAHGPVDMRKALAVSSNVYFYTIGGGFGDIKGLGVENIKKYASLFHFGEKTGIDLDGEEAGAIPGPDTKKFLDPEDPVWRIGDTYNISIGQGGWQVTPVQMVSFVFAMAGNGIAAKPHLLKAVIDQESGVIILPNLPSQKSDIPVSEDFFRIVKEGMRETVKSGTAQALSGLNLKVAGKTGTAEIGSGKYVNSWFIGFFPYENPKIALAVVFEKGDSKNLVGGVSAAYQLIEWIAANAPDLLGN